MRRPARGELHSIKLTREEFEAIYLLTDDSNESVSFISIAGEDKSQCPIKDYQRMLIFSLSFKIVFSNKHFFVCTL